MCEYKLNGLSMEAESSKAERSNVKRAKGKKLKCYLDMCVFNRPFDDQSALRVKLETVACQMIFEKIQKKEVELVWSFMLEFENELNPFTERKSEISLLSRLAGHIVEPSQDILAKAEEVEQCGIKGNDAVHLACALISDCGYFVTCDDRIIQRSESLDLRIFVCIPLEFIRKEVKK